MLAPFDLKLGCCACHGSGTHLSHPLPCPAGRTPKLGQFALTPEQLSIREYYETLTDEFEGASPRAAISYTDGMRSSESELDSFPALALSE